MQYHRTRENLSGMVGAAGIEPATLRLEIEIWGFYFV
jgi:hypothetical protein